MPDKDLEEEFNRFLDNVEGTPRMWHSDEQMEWALDIARHFAEWQKQQMMKDAVECTWGSQATSAFMSDYPNIDSGDKVKIIIVKENML